MMVYTGKMAVVLSCKYIHPQEEESGFFETVFFTSTSFSFPSSSNRDGIANERAFQPVVQARPVLPVRAGS